MGLIDVTELLSDPDFVDPLTLINRIATVNSFGENTTSESSVDTIGSVQPVSGKTLMRLPEALRIPNILEFWIKSEIITDGAGGKYPTVILWKGERYNVRAVLPWNNWGAGWNSGVCERESPAGVL